MYQAFLNIAGVAKPRLFAWFHVALTLYSSTALLVCHTVRNFYNIVIEKSRLIPSEDLFFFLENMNTLSVHVNNVTLYSNKIRNVVLGP